MWYDSGVADLFTGELVETEYETNNTYKILLLKTAGFVQTHATVAAILAGAAEEADATNYARGTLGTKTAAVSGGVITWDAADQVFTSLGGASNNTIVVAVIYREVTNDSDSVPICYVDGVDLATNGQDFTIQFNAAGIAHIP